MGTLTWGPWIGAPTPDGVVSIKAKVSGVTSATLRVSTSVGMTNPVTFGPATPNAQGIVEFKPTGLAVHTQHYCVIDIDGAAQAGAQGKFRTAPAAMTAADLKLVFSSCSGGLSAPPAYSNHQSLTAVANEDADLFLHLGDLSYADPSATDLTTFAGAVYDTAFAQSRMKALLSSQPWGYMWSDHDAGANGCDKTSPTRAAARQAFRQYVPHPPLLLPNAETDDNVAPYHEMSWGRVRIFMLDGRLERDVSAGATVEEVGRSRWGAAQKAKLKERMLAARETLLVLNVEGPWITRPAPDADHWAAYVQERQEICEWLVAHNLHTRTIIIEGDGHFLAMDDGSHNYAGCRVPVYNGSPLDRGAMSYSGPYSQGLYLNPAGSGNYIVLDIQDDGGKTITVNGHGINVAADGTRSEVMTMNGIERGPLAFQTFLRTPVGLEAVSPRPIDPASVRSSVTGDIYWMPASDMVIASGVPSSSPQSPNKLDSWVLAKGDSVAGTIMFPKHVSRVKAIALTSKANATATGSGRLQLQRQWTPDRVGYDAGVNRANDGIAGVSLGTDQGTTTPNLFVPPAAYELLEVSLSEEIILAPWDMRSMAPAPLYRFMVTRLTTGDTFTANISLHGIAFMPYG